MHRRGAAWPYAGARPPNRAALVAGVCGIGIGCPNGLVRIHAPAGTLGPKTDLGLFDGFRFDRSGDVWAHTADGMRAFAPDWVENGPVPISENVSDLRFGGLKRNRRVVTARTSLYAVYVNTPPPGW